MAAAEAQRRHQRTIHEACYTPISISLGADPRSNYDDWRKLLVQRASSFIGGQEALLDEAVVLNALAPAAMGEVPDMTPAQFIQVSLRALIRISIQPDSPATKLIETCQFANGVSVGIRQALQVLDEAYKVDPIEPSPGQRLGPEVLNAKWPTTVSAELYRDRISKMTEVARANDLYPQGDAPADQRARSVWFDAISKPPASSPWKSVLSQCFNHSGMPLNGVGTIAQHRAFVRHAEMAAATHAPAPRSARRCPAVRRSFTRSPQRSLQRCTCVSSWGSSCISGSHRSSCLSTAARRASWCKMAILRPLYGTSTSSGGSQITTSSSGTCPSTRCEGTRTR